MRLPALVRAVHLYASLSASFAIGFFALSGLIAELRARDRPEAAPPTVAAELLGDRVALASWLRTRLGLARDPAIGETPDALVAEADDGADRVEATIALPSGALDCARWHPLPADAPRDRDGLARWFAARVGGDVEAGDDGADDAPRIELRFASCWSVASVSVDRARGRWSERRSARPLGEAVADLHSGKHATPAQRVLMDVAAGALLLSTLTGLALGLVWIAARRRRLALVTLAGGCAWLVLLLVGR